jgi:hypothetical protein
MDRREPGMQQSGHRALVHVLYTSQCVPHHANKGLDSILVKMSKFCLVYVMCKEYAHHIDYSFGLAGVCQPHNNNENNILDYVFEEATPSKREGTPVW